MTLSYQDIMETDLGTLRDAAAAWKRMGSKFGTLRRRYDDNARYVVGVNTWTGQGALAAVANSNTTAHEFAAAQHEARAVAKHLKETYGQLYDLKESLKNLVEEAEKKHFIVDAKTGRVQYNSDKITRAEGHDPETMRVIREKEQDWDDAIKKIVIKIDDVDKGVKDLLHRAVTDKDGKGDANGFNSAAEDDAIKVKAKRTEEIADKILSGDDVSKADLSEANRLLRENAGDKKYSQTLLNSIGPDGLVDLSRQLQERGYSGDGAHAKEYHRLENGFSRALATATRVTGDAKGSKPGSAEFRKWLKTDDGKWYKKFTDGFKAEGRQQIGATGKPLHGYQPLVSMMNHGNAKYDGHFLSDIGNDIIKAEKSGDVNWDSWNGGYPGVQTDPLDGLLNVMSRTPDAATDFLGPDGKSGGADDKNGNLHYLLGKGEGSRDWPQLGSSHPGQGSLVEDPTSRQGLAAALEAGTTGREPLSDGDTATQRETHTKAQSRLMYEALNVLDTGSQSEVHENLRKPLANALADFTPDTHQILSGNGGEGYYDSGGGDGVFEDETGGGHHLAVRESTLMRVMRPISADPEAYGMLNAAENLHANNLLDDLPSSPDPTDRTERQVRDVGKTLGAYGALREAVINDVRADDLTEAQWKTKALYHSVGIPFTMIPYSGDTIQRGVDMWSWEIGNKLESKVNDDADTKIADEYFETNRHTQALAREWVRDRVVDESEKETREKAKDVADELQAGVRGGRRYGEGLLTKKN